jgi:hypothetical protein
MAEKFGSASVFYLVDGRSLIGSKPKGLSYKITAQHEDTTGIGDTIMNTLPTGVSGIDLQQSGAYFDTTNTHTFLSDVADSVQETASVACVGFGGNTLGQPFVGFGGIFKAEYDVIAQGAKLTKANTKFAFGGAIDSGVILSPLAAATIDANGTTVDQLAGTTAGGAGYVQCTAFSGLTNVIYTIEHSTDGLSWGTLITFSTITAAPTAERVAVSGTVNRYVRAVINVTGTGSATALVGFKRN